MMICRKLGLLAATLVIGTYMFTIMPMASAVEKYNWSEKKAEAWNLTSLSAKQVEQAAVFTESKTDYGKGTTHVPSGYYRQGGIVTEKYYVFSVYNKNSDENRNEKSFIYIADRNTNTIVKTISGNWGHMNSFYYDWGTGQVRIHNPREGGDGCVDLNTLKLVNAASCASKSSLDYGVQGLTGQGEATEDNYVYTVGWDSGNSEGKQKYTWERNSNILFIYEKDTEKLVKSFYIPKSVVNGEIEDVSIDGNGDVYLFYAQNLSGQRRAAFYKIDASIVGTTRDKTKKQEKTTNEPIAAPEEPRVQEPEAPSITKSDEESGEKCNTSILGGEYCSIGGILQLVVKILSGGVGIAGTAGIVWAGIVIATAKDDAARLALGKKRLFEILIGLVLYAVAAGLILWLIPN